MTRTPPLLAAWLSAATIFVSAFLLFQVQPLISKAILPWFGGSPAVWSTCVLFFQLALLAGYAYAHWLQRSTFRWKYVAHGILLGVAICLLPIIPADSWKPQDGSFPTSRILALLTVCVGLPYFLLSSTGPLVQAWFAQLYPQVSPYRLYALSNIGSLGALVSYPFVFEPNFSVRGQGWGWSAGFALFALLAGVLCWTVTKQQAAEQDAANPPAEDAKEALTGPPALWQLALWLGLAAIGTTALLAVTNHLCQDVAVIPFFWIIPLSLYLLSFILCFDRDWWYQPIPVAIVLLGTTLFIELCQHSEEFDQSLQSAVKMITKTESTTRFTSYYLDKVIKSIDPEYSGFSDSVRVNAGSHLLWFFALCMLCHGEIAKLRPTKKYLTHYYLLISAGGALGGMFVSLVCPLIYHTYAELPLCLGLGMVVGLGALIVRYSNPWTSSNLILAQSITGLAIGLVVLLSSYLWTSVDEKAVVQLRNFYGVLSVKQPASTYEADAGLGLYHGRILHGYQYSDPDRRREPNTYYSQGSGVQLAVDCYPHNSREEFRVAVVGLGTGTMAAHGHKGDFMRFYEIDSKMVEIADKYFSYVKESEAQIEIALGDARVSMERHDIEQNYSVIVLDAFSGDAIPVHLLTKEAAQVYFKHLKPEGILAIHTSNRFLDLVPVALGIAKEFGYKAVFVSTQEEDYSPGSAASDWVLLTKNELFLAHTLVEPHLHSTKLNLPPVLWTDQRSDLYRIMK